MPDHIGVLPGDIDLLSDEGKQILEPRKMIHVPVGQEHRPQLQSLGLNELQDLPGIPAGVDKECLSPLVPEKIAVRPKLAQWETFVLHRRSQLLIPIPNHRVSRIRVTGPSFRRPTSICAPKTPQPVSTPKDRTRLTK